jgi:MerR family transcriptional regulator, thiopeptide resistance regulator
MTGPKPPSGAEEWLSAADCAARTGLTVKALRIYERQGLINPPRSPKGWRRYGPAELARLNSIVILKALGLTLSQIRTVLLTEHPPSLLQILQLHAESWRAKRHAAERALNLVHAALERLRSKQSPSIAELCELIKELENHRSVDMESNASLTRQLINENTTPEEERAWITWCAEHPEDVLAIQGFAKDNQALSAQALQLMEQGVDPASHAMQALLRQQNELVMKYDMRERNRKMRARHAVAIEKWWGIGVKKRRLSEDGRGAKLMDYWATAVRNSPLYKALKEVSVEVREIMRTQTDPASAELDGPIGRIRAICAQYNLGDALTFTEWRRLSSNVFGPYAPGTEDLYNAEWDFIQRALEVRVCSAVES